MTTDKISAARLATGDRVQTAPDGTPARKGDPYIEREVVEVYGGFWNGNVRVDVEFADGTRAVGVAKSRMYRQAS